MVSLTILNECFLICCCLNMSLATFSCGTLVYLVGGDVPSDCLYILIFGELCVYFPTVLCCMCRDTFPCRLFSMSFIIAGSFCSFSVSLSPNNNFFLSAEFVIALFLSVYIYVEHHQSWQRSAADFVFMEGFFFLLSLLLFLFLFCLILIKFSSAGFSFIIPWMPSLSKGFWWRMDVSWRA